MGLNDAVSAERIHIGFFGLRNAGKSSVVNAVTGQDLSVVSDVKGTTTDPVKKAMELLPLGPVVIIDTPGLDDEGKLGELRKKKARQVLAYTDIAVLVVDAAAGVCELDSELESFVRERGLPFIIAYNKSDLLSKKPPLGEHGIYVSALTGEGIKELKDMIGALAGKVGNNRKIVSDLLSPGDTVVMVIPVDAAAPKGRLILPQQQTIRDVLDSHCTAICCQPEELSSVLNSLSSPPSLVITDSQAFGKVAKDTPSDILLTSFSILFARYKGDLETLVRGAAALSGLKNGDLVIISEGCTHHRQCGDIGTEKLPRFIENFTGVKPQYKFTSGTSFPDELNGVSLVIHCGGCMLNEAEMKHRIAVAKAAGVPIVNYGIAIAHMHGILRRSLQPFPHVLDILEKEQTV